eukprot:CAMPEP_0203666152 /NCGR_PEP_ID=MMETSP0090-20130426/3231_1 /ASSEMBLY_ACC=CAM_ASM_001088 /TAXON_ID=426623 /ORGANISM="Chaetoceros affinis, Strain CCMP159" /LENGTH=815 /DNA_ID=CAMNT_0050529939 /DNA_START=31 /DNA_END=2478 /DNA_ORIENTATION=+
MKFGRNLEEGIEVKWQSWRSYAVNYNGMKKLLPLPDKDDQNQNSNSNRNTQPSATDSPSSPSAYRPRRSSSGHLSARDRSDRSRDEHGLDREQSFDEEFQLFWKLYHQSIASITTFYKEELASLKSKLKTLQSRLENVRQGAAAAGNQKLKSKVQVLVIQPVTMDVLNKLNELKKDVIDFHEEVDLVLEFIDINRTAFRKILKKYDKRTSSSIQEQTLSALIEEYTFLDGGGEIRTYVKCKLERMLVKVEKELFKVAAETAVEAEAVNGNHVIDDNGEFHGDGHGNANNHPASTTANITTTATTSPKQKQNKKAIPIAMSTQPTEEESIYPQIERETLEKAQTLLNSMDNSPLFSSNIIRNNPQFSRREIEIGKYLGEGQFGIVHEIKAFRVKEMCPICFLHQEGLGSGLGLGLDNNNHKLQSGESSTEKSISITNTNIDEMNAETTRGRGACAGSRSLLFDEDDFKLSVNRLGPRTGSMMSIEDMNDFEDDHVEEAEELVSSRGFMKEHCFRKGSARYAIKEVKRSLKGYALADGAIDICIEAKFLSVLSHPNIIKLCGISKIGRGDPRTFIVLDRLYDTLGTRINTWSADMKIYSKGFCGGFCGMLKHKQDLHWLWNERLLAMFDIARAMKYLHSNEIIYRDLKPENAGFDVRGNVKLFDFGLAKELQAKDRIGPGQYNASGRTGTRRYMSPEVALCIPYGKPADVYSFAILLWEVLALDQPYKGYGHEKHAKDVVQKGKRPEILNKWPTFIKTLISESWAANPSSRPDFNRICSIIKGELVTVDLKLSDRTNDLMDVSLTNRDLHRRCRAII